jgi:sugar phosphate isomerase/epimerase
MSPLSRREFLLRSSLAAASAPAFIQAAVSRPQLPIAFSTLGCPKWDWETILRHAAEWGFAAIEIRGINGQLDLPKCPEFGPDRIKGSLKDLAALNLKISDLGSSVNLHEPEPGKNARQLDDGKRFPRPRTKARNSIRPGFRK